MREHAKLGFGLVVAVALLAGSSAGVGCAKAVDNETDSGSGANSSQGGGGSTTTGSAGGGIGGMDMPCAIDCASIQTPQCQHAQCNAQTQQCEIVPDADGGTCNDGVFCTDGDTCESGTCVGGPPNTCGMAPAACQLVTCDETTQGCMQAPQADGTACQPADLCITGATCANGLCTGGTPQDCFFFPVPNECHVAQCNAMTGMCEAVPGNEGNACTDPTDLCTLNKTCSAGTCQGGTPMDCTYLTMGCDLGICDTANGMCTTMAVMNGQVCDDLNGCTTGEICTNGNCGGGTPITNCSLTGDGCCPTNCNAQNDLDCQIPQSCNALKMAVPNSTSGVYTIDPDLSGPIQPFQVYCDMSNGTTYEAVGIGNHNSTVTGWTWISAAALQSATVQDAFVFLYNQQGGLPNITPNWTSSNCCVREAGSDLVLFLGGNQTRPANPTGTALVCQSTYPETMLRFGIYNVGPAPLTLPANFFQTYPPTAQTACADSNNPGFFFKQYI